MRQLLLAMVSLGWVVLAAAPLASCKKENAEYCSPDEPASAEQHPLNRCADDEVCLVGIANSCLPKAACDDGSLCDRPGAGDAPFCVVNADTRSATCEAACTANVQCAARSADLPLCAGGDCVQCLAGADCESTLCNTDNTCVDAAEVAYAAHNGSGSTCTLAAPCDFATALTKVSATVKYIKLAASSSPHYQGPFTIGSLEVTIVGELDSDGVPTAIFRDTNVNDTSPLFDLPNNDFEVTFFGVSIREANSTQLNGAINLRCEGTGELSILNSYVTESDGIGIKTGSACILNITASTIAKNDLGGLEIEGPFSITNNFIAFNGNVSDSTKGGVVIDVANVEPRLFAHNSVVKNFSTVANSGIECSSSGATVLQNNIVAFGIPAGTSQVDLSNQCTMDTTAAEVEIGANPVEVSVFPFVNAATSASFDLHLTAALPAQGTPIAAITTDIDGDARSTTAPDIGADER